MNRADGGAKRSHRSYGSTARGTLPGGDPQFLLSNPIHLSVAEMAKTIRVVSDATVVTHIRPFRPRAARTALAHGRAGRRKGVPDAGGSCTLPYWLPGGGNPRNIARNYAKIAKDLQEGTHTAPSFDDAVALHRVIAAVEEAAETGRRTKLTW